MRNIMDNERSYMKTLFRFFVAAVFDQLQLSKVRQQRRILDSESQKRLENVVYEDPLRPVTIEHITRPHGAMV